EMRVKPKKKTGKASATEPRPFPPDAARNMRAAASLAVLTFLAFANSLSAGFVLDNKGLLLRDPRIRELTGENIRLILQHTYWWPTGEAGEDVRSRTGEGTCPAPLPGTVILLLPPRQ